MKFMCNGDKSILLTAHRTSKTFRGLIKFSIIYPWRNVVLFPITLLLSWRNMWQISVFISPFSCFLSHPWCMWIIEFILLLLRAADRFRAKLCFLSFGFGQNQSAANSLSEKGMRSRYTSLEGGQRSAVNLEQRVHVSSSSSKINSVL